MDPAEIGKLIDYAAKRLDAEARASKSSAPATVEVVRMVALAIVERIAPRLARLEERTASHADSSVVAALQTRIDTLERRLREVERRS